MQNSAKSTPMVKSVPVAFAVGDVVRLKKSHPCGGFDWSVVRLGADIGITCQICGRRVLLPRRDLERRMKLFVSRGPAAEPAPGEVDPVSSAMTAGESGA
jgi:hypothetical protein